MQNRHDRHDRNKFDFTPKHKNWRHCEPPKPKCEKPRHCEPVRHCR
jgi:hypothetical protein